MLQKYRAVIGSLVVVLAVGASPGASTASTAGPAHAGGGRLGGAAASAAHAAHAASIGAAGAHSARAHATATAPAVGPDLTVVASDMNNPRHLSFGPDGALYVAEAGSGGSGQCQHDPNTNQDACIGASGSVTRIANGTATRVLTGLPSVAGREGFGSTGPADVTFKDGKLTIAMQDTTIDATGSNGFGGPGHLLGHLVTAAPGSTPDTWNPGPDFAAFEAAHNPDNGAGAADSGQSAIDSDPYAVTPYQGGWAVADAAGNDLLWVDPAGAISVLAVFPTRTETFPPGFAGPDAVTAPVQSVPTTVRVGPDGALYVGELGPGLPNTSRVWRVVAGQAPTVFADGFTGVSDLAFDHEGRLVVLEIAVDGLSGVGQSPGAVIRVEPNGLHTVLVSGGLFAPTGMAIAADDSIYISNGGIFPSTGQVRGEILKLVANPAPPAYLLAGADGSVYGFGIDQTFGSAAGKLGATRAVGIASTPDGGGYWLATSDGGVFAYGDASFSGSMGGKPLNRPIVGIAATPDGGGYWLVASDGGIFNFGDAPFMGSTGAIKLNQPIVGIAAPPDGGGYWLVAADGGIFGFGTAAFHGSTGGMRLNRPIVGMAVTGDGAGYWLVASDGGIFGYGDAVFLGSTGSIRLVQPIVAMVPALDGSGYHLIAADGGVFDFQTGAFAGSLGGKALPGPIVAATS
jgi:hypothetical protein